MHSDSSQRSRQSIQQRLTNMGSRLRERSRHANGFSLVELLVVILIVGVLAAIAIPSFVGQKGKAVDAQAKELVRTAETTAESMATASNSGYEKVTPTEMNGFEPAIHIVASKSEAYLSAATGTATTYSVTTKSTNGDEFTITKTATGQVTRQCVSPLAKTGCAGAETATW